MKKLIDWLKKSESIQVFFSVVFLVLIVWFCRNFSIPELLRNFFRLIAYILFLFVIGKLATYIKERISRRLLLSEKISIQVTLVSLFAIVIGILVFGILQTHVYEADSNIADILSTTITIVGTLTVGGAAVIQLRKHKLYEEQAELDREVKTKQLEAMEQDRAVKEKQLEATDIDRFTKAYEHLRSDSLFVRMDALLRLEKLGKEKPEEQKSIVRILSSFIIDHIQSERTLEKGYFIATPIEGYEFRPNVDVFFACEIASQIWVDSNQTVELYLRNLQAQQLDLIGVKLKGANLSAANFHGAELDSADLEGAELTWSNLLGTKLECVRGFNIKQLTHAPGIKIDETTLLSPSIRIEYDLWRARLKTAARIVPLNKEDDDFDEYLV
ncbi:MAG: pentapeptide repeat-containing protein [Oscillospiraceae bacterium]|nr:pentapeptide repeat-containing protein [Oscillospiraceae bacterium]